MTTPTTGNQGTNLPSNLSTPVSASQEARRRTEEWKRRVEEPVSESGSSEEEEEEDPISLSFHEEEYQGSETPFQSDPVDQLETPPFQINRPTTYSTLERPIARFKRKATRKQSTGAGSDTRKRRMR